MTPFLTLRAFLNANFRGRRLLNTGDSGSVTAFTFPKPNISLVWRSATCFNPSAYSMYAQVYMICIAVCLRSLFVAVEESMFCLTHNIKFTRTSSFTGLRLKYPLQFSWPFKYVERKTHHGKYCDDLENFDPLWLLHCSAVVCLIGSCS